MFVGSIFEVPSQPARVMYNPVAIAAAVAFWISTPPVTSLSTVTIPVTGIEANIIPIKGIVKYIDEIFP